MSNNYNKVDPFFKDSIIGRVFRGFFAELDIYRKDRINDDYINSLIQRESESLTLYGKLFKSLLILNSISLLLIQGELANHKIFGYVFSNVPASSGILSLLIGINLFAFCVNNLDIILYSMIRGEVIRRRYKTDLVNIATAHIKSGNLWLDLISPRYIGYCSSKKQKFFLNFLSYIFTIFTCVILIATLISLTEIFSFSIKNYELFSYVGFISMAGVLMGSIGIILFFCTRFVPCKFSIPDLKKNS